jgi:4-hydroxybenzoate polyprenyltransferase
MPLGIKIFLTLLALFLLAGLVGAIYWGAQDIKDKEFCQQNGYIEIKEMFGTNYCIGINTDGTFISIPIEDLRGRQNQ